MQLTLQQDEAAILKDALTRYVSDLRMEVGRTENFEARQELHRQENVLKEIIARLG